MSGKFGVEYQKTINGKMIFSRDRLQHCFQAYGRFSVISRQRSRFNMDSRFRATNSGIWAGEQRYSSLRMLSLMIEKEIFSLEQIKYVQKVRFF